MTKYKKLLLTATILTSIVSALPAHAQIVTDEIIVTSQKRSQSIQDVPVAVTAYTGEQIEALGIDNTTEITQQIPSLQVSQWSPNLTIFNIRGVSQNNFTDNLEAPIAVYLDDAYMGSINGLSGQLFDVERVEVLRGPQGTLFGRNATGGLIHYITRDASEEDANGYLKGTYGSFNRVGIEGAIGGAVSDNVRVRLAAQSSQADGYVKATAALPGVFEAGTQDLGGEDAFAIRATIQADITENLQANFSYKHSRDDRVDTGGYVFENCNTLENGYCSVNGAGLGNGDEGVINGITLEPASPFENFSETPGFLDREVNSYQAKFDYSFGSGMELTSITNITNLEKDYLEDGDALPVPVINFGTSQEFKQFSQEIRLAGTTDRTKWQVGGYYLDMELDGDVLTVGAPVIGAAFDTNGGADDPSVLQDYVINSKNLSVFGQVEFALSDALNLTVGGRYSMDDKDNDYVATLRNGSFGDTVQGTDETFAAAVPGINEIEYNDWAGRLALDYKLNDDTLLFASVNRGIKGGNWTLAADVAPETFRHDPEQLTSFETGFKTALNDGSLKINGTAFIYDYNDYQAFAVTGGTPQVTNSDAKSHGAELEILWAPTSNLDVILGGAYLDTEVEEVRGPQEQFGPEFFPGAPDAQFCENQGGFFFCDYPDNVIENAEFPNAPKFSANYLFRYNMDTSVGNVAAQFDGAYYGEQFMEVTNGPSAVQEAYNVSNMSLTWVDSKSEWEASVFAKNVFDQEYRAYTLNLGILGTTSFYAPPRTYGASLKRSF